MNIIGLMRRERMAYHDKEVRYALSVLAGKAGIFSSAIASYKLCGRNRRYPRPAYWKRQEPLL